MTNNSKYSPSQPVGNTSTPATPAAGTPDAADESVRTLEQERETLIDAYLEAFDIGHIADVEQILWLAQQDPVLDRQIATINAGLHREAGLSDPEQN